MGDRLRAALAFDAANGTDREWSVLLTEAINAVALIDEARHVLWRILDNPEARIGGEIRAEARALYAKLNRKHPAPKTTIGRATNPTRQRPQQGIICARS